MTFRYSVSLGEGRAAENRSGRTRPCWVDERTPETASAPAPTCRNADCACKWKAKDSSPFTLGCTDVAPSELMQRTSCFAKMIFDGLYRFYRSHPSRNNPRLMAWSQIKGCGNAPKGDDSAADGDLDIAYALWLADRQWGSAGEINYSADAKVLLEAILSRRPRTAGSSSPAVGFAPTSSRASARR